MKMNIKQNAIGATLVASAVVATWLVGSPANAQPNVSNQPAVLINQPAYEGKFTLTHDTRWGKALLPAGEYRLRIESTENPVIVFVEDAKSGKPVAMVMPTVREATHKGNSALLIGTRGTQRVVHSFRVAELREVLISDPRLAHGRVTEEARQTEAVPVLVAKK
jgi:hypothetical protein